MLRIRIENPVMGVPITFLDKYNPQQFEIIKFRHGDDGKDLEFGGTTPYFRILIRRKLEDITGETKGEGEIDVETSKGDKGDNQKNTD